MRIRGLHIEKLRGIIDLELDFRGKNVLIVGPNGTGKSAVVDAIDFLLSGNINRLTGGGTGNLSLKEHGPYIGSRQRDARVTAELEDDSGEVFAVSRTVAQNESVIINEQFAPIFSEMCKYTANRAYYISRRELLRFILVQPAQRSEQIQTLLGLKSLDEKRNGFLKLKNKIKRDTEALKESYTRATNYCLGRLDITDKEGICKKINELRLRLGGNELSNPETEGALTNLSYSDSQTDQNCASILNNLETVEAFIKDNRDELLASIEAARASKEAITKENGCAEEADTLDLINKGIGLLKGTGECPLCLHKWISEDELRELLIYRRQQSESIISLIFDFDKAKSRISNIFMNYTEVIKRTVGSLHGDYNEIAIEFSHELETAGVFSRFNRISLGELDSTSRKLFDYIKNYESRSMFREINRLIMVLKPQVAEQGREKSKAWQQLIYADSYYRERRKLSDKLAYYENCESKVISLYEVFQNSQEHVLNNLYDKISSRFAEFYQVMHRDDEGRFSARIEKKDPGIHMMVDFYDKGMYPPNAYHSEGHQDSMGLAIFFALMEELTGPAKGIVVLDDVVMSIDNDHRKGICDLINMHFRNKQFIITTHDSIWKRQLITQNVVERDNCFNLHSWTIEEGATIVKDGDIWKAARERIGSDKAGAAHYMRRELEGLYSSVCDSLKARIPYKANHKWDYGEFLFAANECLLNTLKLALKAAENGNKVDQITLISSLRQKLIDDKMELDKESWVVNLLVHKNDDLNFSDREIRSAIDRLERFSSNFICGECKGFLRVIYDERTPVLLKCNCGSYCSKLD